MQQSTAKFLFTRLRQQKKKQHKLTIRGIEQIDSDEEKHQFNPEQKNLIKNSVTEQLQPFIEQKVIQVVQEFILTGKPVSEIMSFMHSEIEGQILEAFTTKQKSVETTPKHMESTLGDSKSHKSIETPCFDGSIPVKTTLSTPSYEFTLGNKKDISSGKRSSGSQQGELKHISEFSIGERESSSRRIKERIMNSNKNRKK